MGVGFYLGVDRIHAIQIYHWNNLFESNLGEYQVRALQYGIISRGLLYLLRGLAGAGGDGRATQRQRFASSTQAVASLPRTEHWCTCVALVADAGVVVIVVITVIAVIAAAVVEVVERVQLCGN